MSQFFEEACSAQTCMEQTGKIAPLTFNRLLNRLRRMCIRNWFLHLLLPVALLAGCSRETDNATTTTSAGKKIVVASEASFPPMEYVDDDGKIVGFDIDLIRAVAKASGLEVEIKNVAWDGIFGALQSKDADVIVSSVTITDDRRKQFDFSEPYMKAGQVIMMRITDKGKYNDLASLSGKVVGVQMGTTAAERMQKEKVELKQYQTAGLAIIDLANGNVDAAVIDKPVADYYASKKPEFANKLHVSGEPQTDEQFGFVVRKGETELLKKLNDGLAKIRQDGTFDKIQATWFR